MQSKHLNHKKPFAAALLQHQYRYGFYAFFLKNSSFPRQKYPLPFLIYSYIDINLNNLTRSYTTLKKMIIIAGLSTLAISAMAKNDFTPFTTIAQAQKHCPATTHLVFTPTAPGKHQEEQ